MQPILKRIKHVIKIKIPVMKISSFIGINFLNKWYVALDDD